MKNKTLKLIDCSFINDEKTGFLRKYHEVDYHCPLSPQAMAGLVLGPDSTSFDKEKNDVWAIGITVLSSLVNDDFDLYYDWEKLQIKYNIIQERVASLRFNLRYSEQLIGIVEKMLIIDDFYRIGVNELVRLIRGCPGGRELVEDDFEELSGRGFENENLVTDYSDDNVR